MDDAHDGEISLNSNLSGKTYSKLIKRNFSDEDLQRKPVLKTIIYYSNKLLREQLF